MFPKIDLNKCDGDGICAENCPANVFELKNKKSTAAHPEDCTECGICVENCPQKAIELVEK